MRVSIESRIRTSGQVRDISFVWSLRCLHIRSEPSCIDDINIISDKALYTDLQDLIQTLEDFEKHEV